MQIKMTIDECLEFADEWSRGMTIHEGSQGWRVVCMLLANEVRRLRQRLEIEPGHGIDGVACRDATISLQDSEIERLRADLARANEIITTLTDDDHEADMAQSIAEQTELFRLRAECATLRSRLMRERERCISIIYGMCGSDNVAQRTVDAIRKTASD